MKIQPSNAIDRLRFLGLSFPVWALLLALSLVVALDVSRVAAKTVGDDQLRWNGGEEDLTWPAQLDVAWYDNYADARSRAIADGRMLFIYFRDAEPNRAQEAFETTTLANAKVREDLQKYVVVRVSVDEMIDVDGKQIRLIDHGAFAEMGGHQGIAIVDYLDANSEHYGQVVSAFPFRQGSYYRAHAVSAMLELPEGTLTQRTMIFAVRMHPDGPRSTQGEFNPVLAEEAESHSTYQARIRLQGHHSWDMRFHRISARLRGGSLPREVVAESWGGESLVDACHECVRSWRQSSGHWGAVRSPHKMFAFDIKRGSNGVWYATGIFAEGG
ncbi:MAG: hypothetical protein KDA63_06125 [Planctomycetales bacterium]|nr:hypothetical protein [Planctomycetales bacterium]